MNIYASKSKGIEYRKGTVLSAIHETLSGMSKGDKVNIDRVMDRFEDPIDLASIRMNINRISEKSGIKYATKKKDGSLVVMRIN